MDVFEFWKTHQRCNKCGQVKPFNDFYAKPDNKCGYGKICKECARAEANARRAAKQAPARKTAPVIPRAPHQRAKLGFLYIMINPAYPNYYKVGVTADPTAVLSTANAHDPHRKWEIIYQRATDDTISMGRTVCGALEGMFDSSSKWYHCTKGQQQFVSLVRSMADTFDRSTAPGADDDEEESDLSSNPFFAPPTE